MTKSVSKVIYKPDTQSTDEFIAFINHDQASRVPHVQVSIANLSTFFSITGGKKEVTHPLFIHTIVTNVIYVSDT